MRTWQPARQVTALQSVMAANGNAAKNSGAIGDLTTNAPLPDQWYYRVDDRERGPLKLGALQELIASSGQTAEEVVIRQAGSLEWTPFYRLPSNSGLARARDSRADRGAMERNVLVPMAGVESSVARRIAASACATDAEAVHQRQS